MAKSDEIMKDHVSAARKWLGKAETSLDNKNSIRGDMHIMLAEAELKCAREKIENVSKPFWKKHMIPLAFGILFAAAGCFWLQNNADYASDKVNMPAVVSASMTNKHEETSLPENNVKTVPDEIQKTASADTGRQPDEAGNERIDAVSTNTGYKEAQQPSQVVPKAETQVPSKEVQQLMRTAKKTLQEQ